MGFEKAVIRKKVAGKEEEVMKVQFNPDAYTLARSSNYMEIIPIGREASEGKMQFKNSSFYDFKTTLLFDHYETKEDVRVEIKKLAAFLGKNTTTHIPDQMIFAWGTFIFTGFLVALNEHYIMFHSDGKPIRAKVEISLKGIVQDVTTSTNRQKMVTEKVQKLIGVQQLWEIAQKEYNDPAKWRKIAELNGILNPRKIRSAQELKVR